MAALPPVRRIVTGHDEQGKAIISSDTNFTPIDPHLLLNAPPLPTAPTSSSKTAVDSPSENKPSENGGFILLWRTSSFPAPVQGPWIEHHGQSVPLADNIGTTVRIVDMPPNLSSPMHRTISLDFGVVLKGEVALELNDGVETVVREGELVVQRGTIHAWHNRSDEMARVLFVLCPSEPVVFKGQKLEATKFIVN